MRSPRFVRIRFKFVKGFSVIFYFVNSTKSNLMLKGEDGENDKDISRISIKNNKVSDFDYISFAQMVSLCDLDNDDMALIEFEKFIDIVPKEKVEFLDDCQMLV